MTHNGVIVFLLTLVFVSCSCLPEANGHAPTPPMGWNSYDSYLNAVNESQFLANIAVLSKFLLPYGYELATIDAGWYADAAAGTYMANATMTSNGESLLVPNPTRFPSTNGSFNAIADKVHAMGLKFGIHVMRGIYKSVVEENQPIAGTEYFAQDIAVKNDSCVWWPQWYGVNMSHPAAQAYYDSAFALYASWGVDFVKVDCIFGSRDGHVADILAISDAVSKASSTMLLSLSPGVGATPALAEQINHKVNQYRITNDLWDCWNNQSTNAPCPYDHQYVIDAFQVLPQFQSLVGQPGLSGSSWPDPDMLPLGVVNPPGQSEQMPTGLTQSQQYVLFTLWSIFRAPLIFGGDLTKLDNFTYDLLTNEDVLSMHRYSKDNHEIYHGHTFFIWGANSTTVTNSTYVAFFNINPDEPQKYVFEFSELGLSGRCSVRDLWRQADLGYYRDSIALAVMPNSTVLYQVTADAEL